MLPSSRGSSDSMQVPLWFSGETEVDDTLDLADVESSGNHISAYQIVNLTRLEVLDGFDSVCLRLVRVNLSNFESMQGKNGGQSSALGLEVAEDDDFVPKGLLQDGE